VDSEAKARILLIPWHAWHLRNDVVHAKGMTTIMGLANFLASYEESLNITNQSHGAQSNVKGKGKMNEGASLTKTTMHRQQQQVKKRAAWSPPLARWVKMNSDATFCLRTGRASIGW
jgi:hypothetical protein